MYSLKALGGCLSGNCLSSYAVLQRHMLRGHMRRVHLSVSVAFFSSQMPGFTLQKSSGIKSRMHTRYIEYHRLGRPSPSEAMMHFPHVSDFLPISKKFLNSMENFHNVHNFTFFPNNFSIFHLPKFLMTVLFNWLQILNFPSPLFSLFQYISPLFRKSYNFTPYFCIFPSWFRKIYVFLHTLCFSFPPGLTMMRLCIAQCMYWMPMIIGIDSDGSPDMCPQ